MIAEAMLVRAGVTYRPISGDWAERERQAYDAVQSAI